MNPRRPGGRTPALATALLGAALLASLPARGEGEADADGRGATSAEQQLVSTEQKTSIARALSWLAANQQQGGSWGKESRVADTALAALALMAGGSSVTAGPRLPSGGYGAETLRGPHAKELKKAIQYLADRANARNPEWPAGYIIDPEDTQSRMHGHGFATLALAQALGGLGAADITTINEFMARPDRTASEMRLADQVRWGVERAVRCSERAQDAQTGGWGYFPSDSFHEGSITVTQISALRAASDAGVSVNGAVMNRAYAYVRESQNLRNTDQLGGFAYMKSELGRVSYPLTAAALTTLFGLGRYGADPSDRKAIDLGLAYMDRNLAEMVRVEPGELSRGPQWAYYGLFYGAQALYLANDQRRLADQWPRIRRAVLARQYRDGSFRDLDGSEAGGIEYSTAIACLTLQVPLETLPIFQRR
ncbi:MAG: hypothetical protein HMLKMBBP_01757 [Planctomycetes bacterium]|nr:hypothetical protein [Planctomycetota bacterium]